MNLKSSSGRVANVTLISILIVFIIYGVLVYSIVNVDRSKQGQAIADGFTISNFDLTLDVKENNIVNVTEKIGTYWNESNHHGIYRFIPEWLEYTGKNGKTIKRRAKVLNLRAIGEQYSTDIVNKKIRIKIGDPYRTLDLGKKEYQIQYQYDMGSDPYKNGDEFIFHAFGDFWGTDINSPSIKIIMPKKFDSSKIKFFADKYRKENVTEYVDYYTRGNTVYTYFMNSKYFKDTGKTLKSSLTIDIELPEGYFENGSWNYGVGSLIISIIIIILTLIIIIWWIKYGKDLKKEVQTVEFYPPDDLSSAEIGYIYGNKNTKKLTISLLISLATKKYIKIDNIEDNKIQITSCIGLKPNKPEDIEKSIPSRYVEINRLKNIDEILSEDAKTMMKFLFKNGGKKRVLKSNFKKFDNVKNELVNGGYIEIVNDNDKLRWEGQEAKIAEYNTELNKYENKLNSYNNSLADLQPLNEYEKIVYDVLFEKEDKIILSEHLTFYTAFQEIGKSLDKNIKNKVNDLKASKLNILSVIITIAIMTLNVLSYFIIEDLDPSINIFYIISFVCVFISCFFSLFMERKTFYGEIISAKIKGFKNFLNTVEKYRLEELVEENPEYFYNILPYTYVLGISKKWINKFEKISIPNLDMGNFDYSSDSAWNNFYSDIYIPAPSGGGNSGGSCGGGCSSCGGGCSSCGGGGSW